MGMSFSKSRVDLCLATRKPKCAVRIMFVLSFFVTCNNKFPVSKRVVFSCEASLGVEAINTNSRSLLDRGLVY